MRSSMHKMNLSFAGCGFLGIYHVGVAVCFRKYAPHLLHKISGASAGALAATCLLCDMPLGEMTSDFFRVVNEARSHTLGTFSPSFNIQTSLFEGLQKFLPEDAHERVNGKLHISLTRVYDGKNVIVSQFNSREDLLQALLCACFIPVFSGILPPRFHGVRYMDGAFSNNLPTLDENTVTVSPFCGETDICPNDESAQIFHVNWANTSIELSRQNMDRFWRILLPPKPEVLSKMCQQGFDDALHFLHRNNLISCTRCVAVQSTFIVSQQPQFPSQPQDVTQEMYDPECIECQSHRKEAINGNMPDTVLNVFQSYINDSHKGIMNWVFRHSGGKILKALSLPATLPADLICASLTKLLLTTNQLVSIVGGVVERQEFRLLANFSVVSHPDHILKMEYKIRSDLRRILTIAPSLTNQLWNISKFVLENLSVVVKANKNCPMTDETHAKIVQRLSIAECQPHLNKLLSRCASKLDLMVDDEKTTLNLDLINVMHDHSRPMSRRESSFMLSNHHHSSNVSQAGDVDAFDSFQNILNVTDNQDALYAYYYLDENHKMKVTKIFDVSEAETNLQNPAERENVPFDDNDLQTELDDYHYQHHSHRSQHAHETQQNQSDLFLNDWKCSEIKIEEIGGDTIGDDASDDGNRSMDSTSSLDNLKPEADQRQLLSNTRGATSFQI